MQHSNIVIIIISILLSILISGIIEVNAEEVIEFNWKGYDVTLFIVTESEMPCEGAAGCSIYGWIGGERVNLIYLWDEYASSNDMYGYSLLYHELLHIECQCNWHEGFSWV